MLRNMKEHSPNVEGRVVVEGVWCRYVEHSNPTIVGADERSHFPVSIRDEVDGSYKGVAVVSRF